MRHITYLAQPRDRYACPPAIFDLPKRVVLVLERERELGDALPFLFIPALNLLVQLPNFLCVSLILVDTACPIVTHLLQLVECENSLGHAGGGGDGKGEKWGGREGHLGWEGGMAGSKGGCGRERRGNICRRARRAAMTLTIF